MLSALFAEELSAATPTVEQRPADPLAGLDYPLIVAEVSYLSGLEGSNRFVLLPADAAQLAAAMMGTPETTGDGLSAIELSAVSEAMNQVMSATASELSKALGVAVEASPPTCTIVEDATQAARAARRVRLPRELPARVDRLRRRDRAARVGRARRRR